MGYSGYTEYLCEAGHRTTADAFGDDHGVCSFCGGILKFSNSVDTTNGVIKGDPATQPARTLVVGQSSKTVTVTTERHEPDSKRWRKLQKAHDHTQEATSSKMETVQTQERE